MKFDNSIQSKYSQHNIYKIGFGLFYGGEDVLEDIDSHKVELYSRKLSTELPFTRISRATVVVIFDKTPGC